jgi:subtilisin family serine protease
MDYLNPWAMNPKGVFSVRDRRFGIRSFTKDDFNDPAHPFNQLVVGAVKAGIDVVFAAGNCGQFCPDMRCGALYQGPGHSIFGPHSLSEVLTVGAVRTDAMWLAYSSQGPGQHASELKKPDICAPSQFCENDDAFATNTGTSAACALAAGVIAVLRGNMTWSSTVLPPDHLKQLLIDTARKTQGPNWNNRLGHGILDAKAAYDELKRRIASER